MRPADGGTDLAAVEAGLDALDTPVEESRPPLWRRLIRTALPPLTALVLVIVVWQVLWSTAWWPEFKLPAPLAVWDEFWSSASDGEVLGIVWTSLHRAVLGFLAGVAIGTPLGLLVARVRVVRAAIGPLLTGLQSLPSVAWVPAAVLWFGINDAAIYFVVLLGSVPSIANGLVSGVDQVPPILPRVGAVMGAGRMAAARLILLPAALPGYLAGLKQGWAFSWRSLMAAELIAISPQLGIGLGAYLSQGQDFNDMPKVLAAIFLILIVGVGIDLLVFRPLERAVLRARGLTASL
ncbi:sulfate ABC transporter permease [Prauserella marina]|uniref:NitT/TauT family transport system permease protein n=1 Tax=Prauserella marina TaxID=530584 RepID=A0A222VPP6_9PSEU|nr:ABC transporter permease [Prauserella marina]ASR35896.1 sulfate ABC transporter permease [Prauserella marina]PWV84181.1 NitT/TauT family transport system permease protein [Prauserella marina]SDC28603.1 NitT/TauT family transport system permease protein [Prauserella marina]